MNQSVNRQFIIGLPSAGKTTYLSALWHVVESKEVEGSLLLHHLDGDYSYLNNMRDLWADSKKLPRNKLSDEHTLSMYLLNPENLSVTALYFSDLSGESFQLQWTDRQIEQRHLKIFEEASGGLLFLNPSRVIPEKLIGEANKIAKRIALAFQNSATDNVEESKKINRNVKEASKEIDQDSLSKSQENLNDRSVGKEYDSRNSPTQVQLVDILQVLSRFNSNRPIKVAVIVSAWDLIQESIQPSVWVLNHLPLLHQYLSSNNDVFECKYFGISAQGGDLKEASRLRKYVKQSEKIKVINDDNSLNNDITLPVKWVME